jgi:integrase
VPERRRNPSGKTVWRAIGRAKGRPKKVLGTFERKRDAIRAEDEFRRKPWADELTITEYFERWIEDHPRSDRTNETNAWRIRLVCNKTVEGRPVGDWPFHEFRRRHARDLLRQLVVEEARAAGGVNGLMRSMSAMASDAVDDEVIDHNPFLGVTVKRNDPRVRTPPREKPVYGFDEMRLFASFAPAGFEAMVRTPGDTGIRAPGELIPLLRTDRRNGTWLIQRTAHEGTVSSGTKTDHGKDAPGRRVVVPSELNAMLDALPAQICGLQFVTSNGLMFRDRNFYRDIWHRTASNLLVAHGGRAWSQRESFRAYLAEHEANSMHRLASITPYDCRRSWASNLRAERIDPADLAEIAGHSVATANAHYVQPLNRSFDAVRDALGG